ncbi:MULTISPECIES: hypothetical protein [unclassified Aeromicrobium]|uniref:hypothetical protein n=1 Tax=unclassified Aeromicrobium TaxID=2633570 RepID=UPI00288AAFC2|nr:MULTISPECIES: hypothetical protein [unclassified Aeromicrobium]
MSAINVNRFLRLLLKDQAPAGTTFVTKRPADLGEKLPLVYARHVAGSGMHPRYASWASVTVDAYTAHEDDPHDLAAWAHDALLAAWEQQTVREGVSISQLEVLLPPFDLDDPLESSITNRSTAEYRLLLRAHATS